MRFIGLVAFCFDGGVRVGIGSCERAVLRFWRLNSGRGVGNGG